MLKLLEMPYLKLELELLGITTIVVLMLSVRVHLRETKTLILLLERNTFYKKKKRSKLIFVLKNI